MSGKWTFYAVASYLRWPDQKQDLSGQKFYPPNQCGQRYNETQYQQNLQGLVDIHILFSYLP